MVTGRWDTALDANTMTSYADAAALMKQQPILTIVGWGVEAKILEQWLGMVTDPDRSARALPGSLRACNTPGGSIRVELMSPSTCGGAARHASRSRLTHSN